MQFLFECLANHKKYHTQFFCAKLWWTEPTHCERVQNYSCEGGQKTLAFKAFALKLTEEKTSFESFLLKLPPFF